MAAEPDQPAPPVSDDEILLVCRLLQQHNAKYVLVGAVACGLHGLVRSTQDVDLLVEPSPENLRNVLDALARLPDRAAKGLTVKDLEENVVVKIADQIMVDVAKQAWTLNYEEAIRDTRTLWRSKACQSSMRALTRSSRASPLLAIKIVWTGNA